MKKKLPAYEQNKDTSPWISKEEFLNITFETQWPKILRDLAEYMTGMKGLLKSTSISEADELGFNTLPIEYCKDQDLFYYK